MQEKCLTLIENRKQKLSFHRNSNENKELLCLSNIAKKYYQSILSKLQ